MKRLNGLGGGKLSFGVGNPPPSPLSNVFGLLAFTSCMCVCRFMVDGELKYLQDAGNLQGPERNTLTVSFPDVEEYNSKLATLIIENYYQLVQHMETLGIG